jgi:hypothetical protein
VNASAPVNVPHEGEAASATIDARHPIGVTDRKLLGLGTHADSPERSDDSIARHIERRATVDNATGVGHDLRIRRDDDA